MPLRPSLLAALFGRMITLLVVAIAVIGALAFWSARGEIGKAYDASLVTATNVLYALMGEELRRGVQRSGPLEVDDEPLLSAEDRAAFDAESHLRMFRIWRGGRLVLRSDTGPRLTAPARTFNGFQDVVQSGKTWRVYSLPVVPEDLVIQVGEQVKTRGLLVRRIAVDLGFPLLLLIPAAAGLMWLALRDGLRLLRKLTQELRRRSLHDLSPIDQRHWPADLEPLIGSVNHLFGRLEHAFQQERRFVDHAAHQLRTPLAAIKLQTQMIAREPDAAQRQDLIGQLESSVNRAAALTDRLLTLARLEAGIVVPGEAELSVETAAVLADISTVAESRGVSLVFEAQDALVRGDPTLVRLIAANLIDNAVRHAAARGEVEVSITASSTMASLTVTDDGPGIAPEERLRVFERFYRGPGKVGGAAGLGLAIVAEAVRLLGGEVVLADRSGGRTGLRACVTLPLLHPVAAA
jgi:signal transduction histidine kinase